MARTIVIVVLAAVIGAAGSHLYYRGLDPAARCGWDHPLDASARARCAAGHGAGYGSAARRQLDDLIGNVAR